VVAIILVVFLGTKMSVWDF